MFRPVILTMRAYCIFYFVHGSLAKTFETCELVTELTKQSFPEDQLRDWVCLIEAESSRRTEVKGGPNKDGSYDYGLFQINDRYWCSADDTPGKTCNILCSDLLSDNITDASVCTKKIYKRQGFSAWVGWKNKCKGKKLPELHC